MNFSQIFSVGYFLSAVPNPDFYYAKLFLVLGIVLILGGVFLRVYVKKVGDPILKKMLKGTPWFLKIIGIVLIFLVLIRMAGIPYLSMRLWWLIYGLIVLYYALSRLFRFKMNYRARLQKSRQAEERKKYLPRKKK